MDKKNKAKKILTVLAMILLVVLGIAGTLSYQRFEQNLKAEGVREYKSSSCKVYTDKDVKWLECDE